MKQEEVIITSMDNQDIDLLTSDKFLDEADVDFNYSTHKDMISLIGVYPRQSFTLVAGVTRTKLADIKKHTLANTKAALFYRSPNASSKDNIIFYVVGVHTKDDMCDVGDKVLIDTNVVPLVIETDNINRNSCFNMINKKNVLLVNALQKDGGTTDTVITGIQNGLTEVTVVEVLLINNAFIRAIIPATHK